MIWEEFRKGCYKARGRCIIQAVILILLLSVFTCVEMLGYDAITSGIRHFKIYAYTMKLWLTPLLASAVVSGFLQQCPIRGILVAYLMAELSGILHEVVLYHIWSVESLNVQLFVRFALIQSVLKICTMLMASFNSRTGATLTSICCITGLFYATMYSTFPILLRRLTFLTWDYIAEAALFQLLNVFLGMIAGLFFFAFGRPLGTLATLAIDAPIVGLFAWLSHRTVHLTTLYRSLLILGTMLFAFGMYFVIVRRRNKLSESHMHLPLETRGAVLVIS